MKFRAYAVIDDTDKDTIMYQMTNFLSFFSEERLDSITHDDIVMLVQYEPMRCEICGRKDDTVVYHHFLGRRYKHLVNDNDNRIPLCADHHTDLLLSAHKSPAWFKKVIIEKRGEEWYNRLIRKRNK